MPRRKKKDSVSRFKTHHKVVFSVAATVGAVAIWRGIWGLFDALPIFDNPLLSGVFGLSLLIVAGIYFKLTEFF